ncbi:hypothetical protein ACFO0S_05175 [Chryseomicrobium palamuruense]|uniref:Dipicolinate synthase subunit A n=1 Tax=Chryseomicrobium palamuruense TaxID=682973 RepID=A0ABV8UVE5_9BACL
MKIVIIGTDDRYEHLAVLLQTYGNVSYFQSWEDFSSSDDCSAPIDLLFLPIGKLVNQNELAIPSTVKHVWSGSRQPLHRTTNTLLFHYTEDEDWLWSNAELTADSFLKWLIPTLEKRIASYSFDIAGYGRVGKRVARKLYLLGADVSIRTRSKSQQAEARLHQFDAKNLDAPFKNSICINTIPAPWLSSQQAENLTLILDLASAPGCLMQDAQANYYPLLSLPGKIYPEDAAFEFLRLLIRKGILRGNA